jgi:hypothetical protein
MNNIFYPDFYNDQYVNSVTLQDMMFLFDPFLTAEVFTYKYKIKQGETPQLEIDVFDNNNQKVDIGNPDSIFVGLYSKDFPIEAYGSGFTSGLTFYNGQITLGQIDNISGNKIKVTLNQTQSKKMPIGNLVAGIKIKKGTTINEYKMLLALVQKGITKEITI